MNRLFLILFSIFSFSAHSEEIIFFEGKIKHQFEFNPATQIMITKNCNHCQALSAISNIGKLHLKSGGANPGALICKEQLKAEVITLLDTEKNQNSFCIFKDKSMIALSSLTYRAMK